MASHEESTGEKMHELARRLFPICRSITGDGVRETLKIIKEHIPIKIHEVPSGEIVFDVASYFVSVTSLFDLS